LLLPTYMDPLGLGVHGQWGQPAKPAPFSSSSSVTDPSNQENRAHPPPPGFAFEHPRVPIDWKKIAVAPLQQIARRGDAAALSPYLPTVALGDLSGSGGPDVAHPALLKAFQASQLCVQYLVHCQVSMEGQLNLMSDDVARVERVGRALEDKEERRKKKVKELEKEGKSMKRLIAQYHRMLRKHNPDLARRVVSHGDGRISLVEKDNVFAKGGIVGEMERDVEGEDEDHFYTNFGGGAPAEGEAKAEEEEEEGEEEEEEEEEEKEEEGEEEVNELKMHTDGEALPEKSLVGSSPPSSPLPSQATSPSVSPRSLTSPKPLSSASPSSGPVEVSRSGHQSPEATKMRTTLTELYSTGERDELVVGLSPKQKSEPIMEALRSSGAFEDFGTGSDDDGGDGMGDLP